MSFERCARGRWHGPAVVGNLCRKCAAWKHPGKTFYRGRWRTLAEVAERIQAEPCMRGVVWQVEGEFLVGRKGAFVMKLRTTLES